VRSQFPGYLLCPNPPRRQTHLRADLHRHLFHKVASAKLHDRRNALVAIDRLNDRVLPFFETHEIPLLRILTYQGTEYCGVREHHEYHARRCLP
jgi:hypothetical protein